MKMNCKDFASQYCDFIGMYQNVFEDPYLCNKIIDKFEECSDSKKFVRNRQESEGSLHHMKSDNHAFLNMSMFELLDDDGNDLKHLIYESLQTCLDDYLDKYSILHNHPLKGPWVKIQRTDPGEAYHIWHFENGDGLDVSSRALVWAIFLNDMGENDGGETEFLYQKRRVRPKKNSGIIWPAGFTHTHRGNTVLGDVSKYILTGWINFNSSN